MNLVIERDATPLTVDPDGVARIGGTRVTLDTLTGAFLDGASPEEIALQYPSLDLGDIYAVVAYYLRHRTQVEGYLEGRQKEAREVRRQNETRSAVGGIRRRLLARRSQPRH